MIARSICLYGVTGSGKSGQAGRFARYIYEKTGKVTRYVASDGGDWYSVLKDLIDLGIIEYFDLRPLRVRKPPQSVYAALHRLGRGEWPQPSEGVMKMLPTKDWNRIGAYIIDSGTGCSDLVQNELETSKNGFVSGKDQTFSFELDDERVSGGSWDHIRATQKTIKKLISFFASLPVERIMWTFGEAIGSDKITKKTEYGLAVAGTAVTTLLTGDFGVLLHCEKYAAPGDSIDPVTSKPNPGPTRWRMYFQDHIEPQTGMLYLAKPRCQPTMYPVLLKRWPNGFLEPKIWEAEMLDGLDDFMRFDDELDGRSNKGTSTWKAGLDAARVGRADHSFLGVPVGGEK